ncbi:MAG: MmgE/PrpD family protein [Clostridia bacterium]|nr:MmgE/PrpD family protein [Clostridia bacterium]
MNKSTLFLAALEEVRRKEIPERVMKRARESLADYLAVTCAGAKFQSEKLKNYFAFAMPEEGRFRAIGTGRDLALKEAVFLNGLNGHALDFDDGTNAGIIHLGSPVFSLLLPLAQRYGIGVDRLLRAAIIGYEASFTLAVSIQPVHKALGYHATGTCGTVGAALAAAYMLGFNEEERRQVFACACVAASGMLKVLDDGSELKPYNVAKSALTALTSLQIAKSGFRGHPDPLGGRGFFKMMTGKEDIEPKPMLLHGTYALEKTYTKPYASCRYTHPAVEAAIAFRRDGIAARDIGSVTVKTYALAVAGHDHTEIPGSYSAKMSIPYSFAAGLVFGKAGLNEFEEETVKNEEVRALARKVTVTADGEMSAAFPEKQRAEVTVATEKGRFVKTVDYPKGEPENPLTEKEFKDRFDGLTGYAGISPAVSDGVYRAVFAPDAQVFELLGRL